MQLLGKLALCLFKDRKYNEATVVFAEELKMFSRVFSEEHPFTLTSINNLASTYKNQDRWKKTEELNVRVIKTSLKMLSEKHPFTLTSINNLASTLSN